MLYIGNYLLMDMIGGGRAKVQGNGKKKRLKLMNNTFNYY